MLQCYVCILGLIVATVYLISCVGNDLYDLFGTLWIFDKPCHIELGAFQFYGYIRKYKLLLLKILQTE